MSEHAGEPAFKPPVDVERYIECPRCGYTFERGVAENGACPECHGGLFAQIVMPGVDELALRRAHREKRRRR